jgi:hypothetical protein
MTAKDLEECWHWSVILGREGSLWAWHVLCIMVMGVRGAAGAPHPAVQVSSRASAGEWLWLRLRLWFVTVAVVATVIAVVPVAVIVW